MYVLVVGPLCDCPWIGTALTRCRAEVSQMIQISQPLWVNLLAHYRLSCNQLCLGPEVGLSTINRYFRTNSQLFFRESNFLTPLHWWESQTVADYLTYPHLWRSSRCRGIQFNLMSSRVLRICCPSSLLFWQRLFPSSFLVVDSSSVKSILTSCGSVFWLGVRRYWCKRTSDSPNSFS